MMSESAETSEKKGFKQTAHTALRLGLILVIAIWCYKIIAPFIPLVVWGAVIAVAIYPLHQKLAARLGDRIKLSATLVSVLGLIILTAPVIVLSESLVTSSTELAGKISDGTVRVPPPSERVQSWPLVGEKLYSSWQLASENLDAALQRFSPQLEILRDKLIAVAGGAVGAFLQLFFSIMIAGGFLALAKGCMAGTRTVVNGLVGERASELLELSEETVRSVARGVLGVAIIESFLVAIGLLVAGVPAAGFWTFLVLVLSIIQIPPMVVLIPLIIYVLTESAPFGATVFVVCSVLAIGVDTFVKPVLLGRTADAPMLVILMGAIGGMMVWGIVGLFVGAVTLVVGWELVRFWIADIEKSSKVPSG
jgi:predicted PurR-regulated permease PerM